MLIIGDGRLARHLEHYFASLSLPFTSWSRKKAAAHACPPLGVISETTVLLALSDAAIEPFIHEHPELADRQRVHFSGRLVTPLAIGAHPLFSFADTLYDRATYERIPFILDRGAPPLHKLIPGLPNPFFYIDTSQRERYHALCVLAGNFTTLLWRKLFFELRSSLDLPREQALPYLESTLLGLSGSGNPLSGPLARGDDSTLRENILALEGDPFQNVYQAFVSAFRQQNEIRKDWIHS